MCLCACVADFHLVRDCVQSIMKETYHKIYIVAFPFAHFARYFQTRNNTLKSFIGFNLKEIA